MKICYCCFREYGDAHTVCPHCGQPEILQPKEPIHLAPGTVLAGRYILGEAVGSGGFGIVYRAWDAKLESIVAVKEFFVSRLMTRAAFTKNVIISKKAQEEFDYRKARFLAEARTMAKFGSHRSIPNVFEFFEENGTAYIVMELLQGLPLNEYLHQHNGKMDVDFAVMIANEVGNALKSLHEQGIIHRDVAPDNIFICSGKDLRIKLMDLGAAKLTDSTDEAIDIILKPGYSPTEQYENSKNIGPWTDIYALGATLYAMLCGSKPDESTNRKIADTVIPPIERNPLVSENLSNTVMKAMALDKHMRFKSIPEFLKALNGGKKVVTLAKERRRRSLRRFAGIAAAFAIVAAIGGIVLHNYSQKRSEQYLKAADLDIWYSVAEGSQEASAMEAMVADFCTTFDTVNISLRAIPEAEYTAVLEEAAFTGNLPDLFESTGLPDSVLDAARDAGAILQSQQAVECLFLSQYDDYYGNAKQIPLGIEVPMASVITNGAVFLEYDSAFFQDLESFGDAVVAGDERHAALLRANFPGAELADNTLFMNNSENSAAVFLSSTMALNQIRQTLTNYEKIYVYPKTDAIVCAFTYEWSLGEGSNHEKAAAEKLLCWMLGSNYQNMLMVTQCNDGQIPLNETVFHAKLENRALKALEEIYRDFRFTR